MTAQGKVSKALDEACRAAFLLTGSTEVAEKSVLDGIAALESGHLTDDALVVETVKSAMRRRADLASQSEEAFSPLPWELERLFLLGPISRDCFVLRVLFGMTVGNCSRILRLGIQEFEEMLCAALQELPRLEARRSTRCEIAIFRRLPHYYG